MKNEIEKKKVLILYNKLWHYRLPIFKILGEKYDLTVGYYIDGNQENLNFKTIKFNVLMLGGMMIHKHNLFKLCKNYDVIINGFNLRWINQNLLLLNPFRKYKMINYGINVRASYQNAYGSKTYVDKLRFYLGRKADAMLFYSDDPIKRYIDQNFPLETLFVANNTVEVLPSSDINVQKNTILFVGSLYKEKGIDTLLRTYKKLFKSITSPPELYIIGDGSGLPYIKEWIRDSKLEKFIKLLGPVYDEFELMQLHKKAIVSVSPNQAGLSILKSFGYGVPFITSVNAITGGEIFNIVNGENGYLFKSEKDLHNLLIKVCIDKNHFIELGENAKKYYNKYRTPQIMANGFINAIEYVSNR